MKNLLLILLFLFSCFFFVSYGGFETKTPLDVVDGLKNNKVQDTTLNGVGNGGGDGVKTTLSNIKNEGLNGYIEWMGFIGLSIAFLLIIYNGIVILSNFGGEDKLSKAKKRFVSLILGVVIVTSGYLIIKLVVSLIGEIFK